MNKEAERKISKARVWLLVTHPFFGYLASSLEAKENLNMIIKTMGTDGEHLYYDPDFVLKTPLSQLVGIVAHEVGHVFLWHLPRLKGRNRMLWNFACDYALNPLIRKEFELPAGVLYNPEWDNKSAEYIYNELEKNAEKTSGQTIDDHESWKDWGKGESDGGKDKKGEGAKGELKPDSGKSSEEGIEQEWREKIAEATNQARMRGKLPAYIQEIVDGILQPKLDWKAILRDMITSTAKNDFRIMPPNKKHLWRGFILPGVTGNEIRIGACIDTSGSISNELICDFLSEIKGICEAYEQYTIYLYTADAEIQQEWVITEFDSMLPNEFKGRGGTDFRPAFEKIKDKDISTFIYLTDGYGAYPDKEPNIPVIWVLSPQYQEPPWGRKIILPNK